MRTRRSSASSPSRSLRPSRSSSTPRCASTARGWETLPLPAPDGSGSFAAILDLRAHEAVVEHSDGRERRASLLDRPVGAVTRELLGAARELAGDFEIDPTPQEVPWSEPLDEDERHAHLRPAAGRALLRRGDAGRARAGRVPRPYRGRSTAVNAWWGSFDLAVSLFSGEPAEPPSQDFIMRNSMDAQEVAVGWWPGDDRYGRAAFYAYAHPRRPGSRGRSSPAGQPLGRVSSASTCSTGTTSVRAPTRAAPRSTSPARRSPTPARRAAGTPQLAASAEGHPPPVV